MVNYVLYVVEEADPHELFIYKETAREGIWLKWLVGDLNLHCDQAIIYCDNLSVICLPRIKSIMRGLR